MPPRATPPLAPTPSPPTALAPTGSPPDSSPSSPRAAVAPLLASIVADAATMSNMPPPWERDVDTEPTWDELVGPDDEPGHAGSGVGGSGDVSVSQSRLPLRVVVGAVLAVAVVAVAAIVIGRGSGRSALVDNGIERRLPAALTTAPTRRWRATGLGSSTDEAANGGSGALVAQDASRVYAIRGDGENVLTAIDAATGSLAWTVTVKDSPRALYTFGDAVYVSTDAGVDAYEPRTGALRWASSATFVYEPWPGGPVVGGSRVDAADQSFRLAIVDALTGATSWQTDGGSLSWVTDRRGLVWLSCSSVERRDWADGHVRWSHALDTEGCSPRGAAVDVVGDTVVLAAQTSWLALDLATGAERWSLDRAGGPFETLTTLDSRHVLVADQSGPSGPFRVIDVATGQFVDAELTGASQVVRLTSDGHERLFAFSTRACGQCLVDGSSLQALDPVTYAPIGKQVPIDGSLPSFFGDRAIAADTTYALSTDSGTSLLASYSLSTGKQRWQVNAGDALRLVSVGKVLVVLEGQDLVAYG